MMENKKRVKFGNLKVQKLNRIALPSSLLDNLNIKISDNVELFLDIVNDEIIIRKVKNVHK